MEKIAVLLGSNLFVGTNGVLTVEIDKKKVNFFKIRKIFRILSFGYYLTVDCDIKDKDNNREIKLAKSRPVANPDKKMVFCTRKVTEVKRADGSTVVKIEEIRSDNPSLPQDGPVSERLKREKIDPLIRITGDFYAGPYKLFIDNKSVQVNGVTMEGNLSESTGGLRLTSKGLSF